VLGFGSSTALGSAYGIAVTGTMLITTYLTFYVLRYAWHYNWLVCVLATGFFFTIDATFFSANLLKFAQGGWFPLLVGAIVFVLMSTWKRGREIVYDKAHQSADVLPLQMYLDRLFDRVPIRALGTAAFLTTDPDAVPPAFVSNLEHNGVVHERILFVTVQSKDVPYVAVEDRLVTEPMGHDCFKVLVSYGFKDEVNLPSSLQACRAGDRADRTLRSGLRLAVLPSAERLRERRSREHPVHAAGRWSLAREGFLRRVACGQPERRRLPLLARDVIT